MLALLLMQLAATDMAQPTKCAISRVVRFEAESDLPAGVLPAFGAPMAEKGSPFQSADTVSTPPLPIYRFVHAEQRNCQLLVTYEHGGRGSGVDQALLITDGSQWRRISRLTFHMR